jgi:hypothetical protein
VAALPQHWGAGRSRPPPTWQQLHCCGRAGLEPQGEALRRHALHVHRQVDVRGRRRRLLGPRGLLLRQLLAGAQAGLAGGGLEEGEAAACVPLRAADAQVAQQEVLLLGGLRRRVVRVEQLGRWPSSAGPGTVQASAGGQAGCAGRQAGCAGRQAGRQAGGRPTTSARTESSSSGEPPVSGALLSASRRSISPRSWLLPAGPAGGTTLPSSS